MMGEAEARYRTREWEILHTVCLSAYQIGKYEVTNREYADMLNWAVTRAYPKTCFRSIKAQLK
jgi:formylglycine-generating enzyme required for sulfatase activity